jgi:hypothetical protein
MSAPISPSKNLIWLASYPKSGNTWFRAFLTALFNDGRVDINHLTMDGIFSSRGIFNDQTDLDSTDLYDEEIKNLIPDVYRQVSINHRQKCLFKIHDAFVHNTSGKPIVPEDQTDCAIYFIRNPLDIVASLASHSMVAFDKTIAFMADMEACFSQQKENLNTDVQIRQLLLSWSAHVSSWTSKPAFPVYVVRYEDMVTDTFCTFKSLLSKMGMMEFSDHQIMAAIAASDFNELKKQEQEKGFVEKYRVDTPSFFRKGGTGNFKDELNKQQIHQIMNDHYDVMCLYHYL